jgi:hypothetical protein
MAMLYADEGDAVSALGKGGYVEYDAVAQEWGMGRADERDWSIFQKSKRRLMHVRTNLTPKLTGLQARDTFSPRIDFLERVAAKIESMTGNRDVRIGKSKEHLINRFAQQTRDLKNDVLQQLRFQGRATTAGERGQMHIQRRAAHALARDARDAQRYAKAMSRRGIAGMGDEVDGRPISEPRLPSLPLDTYGGSQLVGDGLGANIWETLGLKSAIKDDLAKGIPLADIFKKWASILDKKASEIPQIPAGDTQKDLAKQNRDLQKQKNRLAPAFATGAQAGSKDKSATDTFVKGVKSFRSSVNAAKKKYGLRVIPDASGEPTTSVVEPMKAEVAGIPVWMMAAGAAAAAAVYFFLKKKK